MRPTRLISAGLVVALGATALLLPPATALGQQPPAVAKPAPPMTDAEAERVFSDLLRRYFDAYARKDLDGMVAEWHPLGPARQRRNVVLVEFDFRQVALERLVVDHASADAGGGRARAMVDWAVTDARTGRVRHERRVRNFTLLPDDSGAWKIWNEANPAGELARRFLAAPPDRRDALLAAEPDLASADTLDGLSAEAGRRQGQGQFDAVLAILDAETQLARTLDDGDAVGRSLVQAGSLHMMTGRSDQALDAFTAASDAFGKTGNTAGLASCDANLANLAYSRGRFADAAAGYQRALDVFARLNDDAGTASALHGLGNALFMQADFAKALESYAQALVVLEREKDTYRQSNVLQAIARVNKELGEYGAAIDASRRSLALAESGGDIAASARALASLGELYRLQGDLGRALQFQLQSLQRCKQVGNATATATATYAVGQVRALQRDLTAAVGFYRQALEIDRGTKGDQAASELGQARDLGGLGGAHFVLGQFDEALAEYRESLALREKQSDQPGVMWTLVHMGLLHASQHRNDDAAEAYARALGLAEPAGDLNAVSTILALRGRLELESGDPDAALATVSRAAGIASSIGHFDTVAYARLVTGLAQRALGRIPEAKAAFEDSVATLARVPSGPAVETFFDDRRAPYVAMVDMLAEQGQAGDAFLWSERLRQRTIADLLGGDGAVVVRGLSAEEQQAEHALERDIRTLDVKARRERGRKTPDAARIAELEAALGARRGELDALRQKLFGAHPALRDLRAQGEPRGAAAAAWLGDAHAVVVSFVVGETRAWVFAVGAGEKPGDWDVRKAVAIAIEPLDLARQVGRFREAIASRSDQAAAAARELRTLLLGPVDAVLAGKTRVVVLPDGALWSLPFEALQGENGRFLVEDAAVSYGPSLTALATLAPAGRAPDARPLLVAFDDPVVSPPDAERLAATRGAATAPVASPAPAHEARQVAAWFGPARSRVYAGSRAEAGVLAQGVPAGALLQLGVPAVLNDATPLYSLLGFSRSGDTGDGSGLVEVASLMNWELPAEATVMDRAEFAQAVGDGAALTAVAWSLAVAGSPTLVIDRWTAPVAGQGVTTRLYRARLAAGPAGGRPAGAAELLRKAMTGILAQAATRHPYYWAGAMVIGR